MRRAQIDAHDAHPRSAPRRPCRTCVAQRDRVARAARRCAAQSRSSAGAVHAPGRLADGARHRPHPDRGAEGHPRLRRGADRLRPRRARTGSTPTSPSPRRNVQSAEAVILQREAKLRDIEIDLDAHGHPLARRRRRRAARDRPRPDRRRLAQRADAVHRRAGPARDRHLRQYRRGRCRAAQGRPDA